MSKTSIGGCGVLAVAAVASLLLGWVATTLRRTIGLLPTQTLRLTAALAPVVVLGTAIGVALARRLSQSWFERASLAASGIAAAALLLR